ncbi:uncharacterized protein [Asterias amurensis]|uniref:uncharacterized protein isoform X1 n=1 Tax=Asterias amurensis TaxID=7602 RepID=UPI003AB496BD
MHLTLTVPSDDPTSSHASSRDWEGDCEDIQFIGTVCCDQLDDVNDIDFKNDAFLQDNYSASSRCERGIRRRRLMSHSPVVKKKRRSYWPSGSVISKKRVFQRSKRLGTSVSKAFSDALSKLEEMSHDSRNRQFHKLFSFVPSSERVIVSYSCALIKEIMLHGRIFISQNWICFHSHIFTFVTQVTIEMSSVTNISKERTAFVIPNAIGIRTDNGKFVFGSLLSRQSTYIQLQKVWKSAIISTDQEEEVTCSSQESSETIESDVQSANLLVEGETFSWTEQRVPSDEECSVEDGCTSTRDINEDNTSNLQSIHSPPGSSSVMDSSSQMSIHDICNHLYELVFAMSVFKSLERLLKIIKAMTPAQFFLLLTACLIVCLTISAMILTYRIARLQPQLENKHPSLQYTQTLSEWSSLWWAQQAAHSQQISQMWTSIADNLRMLAKVHQSLQILQGEIQPSLNHHNTASETDDQCVR